MGLVSVFSNGFGGACLCCTRVCVCAMLMHLCVYCSINSIAGYESFLFYSLMKHQGAHSWILISALNERTRPFENNSQWIWRSVDTLWFGKNRKPFSTESWNGDLDFRVAYIFLCTASSVLIFFFFHFSVLISPCVLIKWTLYHTLSSWLCVTQILWPRPPANT